MGPVTEQDKRYLTAPQLERIPRLVHGFGTAAWRQEDFLDADDFRTLIPVVMKQLHSDIVHVIGGPPAGGLEGDALVTDRPGLLLIVKTADCLPILLADEKRRIVAAVHCGWRSTIKKIVRHTVDAMRESFGAEPGDLMAVLGPCIGPACYEVGSDVAGSFEAEGFPNDVARRLPGGTAKFLLDLRRANAWLLTAAGLRERRILSLEPCTHCDHRLLSYRRDRENAARMFNFIGLK